MKCMNVVSNFSPENVFSVVLSCFLTFKVLKSLKHLQVTFLVSSLI